MIVNENENTLSEKSEVKLDIKTLIGIIIGIVSIAGIWFDLTAKIGAIAHARRRVARIGTGSADDSTISTSRRGKAEKGEDRVF